MAEQRYQAVLAVIGEGRTVCDVAAQWRVDRRTVHRWLARYEAGGLESLGGGSHRPASRFHATGGPTRGPRPAPDRSGDQWVTRTVSRNGVVCVGYQQVSVGKHHGGSACNVLVTDGVLQFWVGNELLKTVARTSRGAVRNKNALGTAPRRHGGARKVRQITRSTTATDQPKLHTGITRGEFRRDDELDQ